MKVIKEGSYIHTSSLREILNELERKNPYPLDIFTDKTEEGLRGRFGHKVWENCIREFKKELKNKEGD
jgi:hypothetical protein